MKLIYASDSTHLYLFKLLDLCPDIADIFFIMVTLTNTSNKSTQVKLCYQAKQLIAYANHTLVSVLKTRWTKTEFT